MLEKSSREGSLRQEEEVKVVLEDESSKEEIKVFLQANEKLKDLSKSVMSVKSFMTDA